MIINSTPTLTSARRHSKWTAAKVGFSLLQGLLVCLIAVLILGLLNQDRKFGVERVAARLGIAPTTAGLVNYLNANIDLAMSREQVESVLSNLGSVSSQHDQMTVLPSKGQVPCDRITLTFPPDEWPILGPIPGSELVWTVNACYDPAGKLYELRLASNGDSDSPSLDISEKR